MALTWSAKAPGDTYRYTWEPALTAGDSLAAHDVSVTGATIDYHVAQDRAVIVSVSGGTAGTTAIFTFTGSSDQGEEFSETIYLPIVSTNATGMTARDVCEFALRKVYGKDETPEASAMSDAIERLNDMLLGWRVTGASIGAAFPLVEASVIYCSPEFQSAIKHNLCLCVAELYDLPITPYVAEQARRGLQLIKMQNLPDERSGVDYY